MFKLLHKYIGKKFLIYFIACFFSLAGLSLLVDIIEMLRRSYDIENISFSVLFVISLTKIPFIMSQILPFCIIIATVITFWNMNKSSELIIYRAIGMSAKNFISPLLLIAFSLGVIATVVFNPIVASTYNKHNKLLEKNGFSSDSTPFLAEDGLWLRETSMDKTLVLYAKNITSENKELVLNNVSIINLEDGYIFISKIEASSAVIKNNYIVMPKAVIFKPEKPAENVIDYQIKTNLSISQLEENMATPETISFWKMPSIINFFEKSGLSSDNYKVYYYSLLANPLTFVAFVFAIVPFMLVTNSRKGGMFFRILLAFASGFILFFFSKITMALGVSDSIPLGMSVLIPAMIASLCGFAAVLHYEDG